MARRQVRELDAPAGEKGVGRDEEGVGPLAHEGAKAASISRLVLALRIWICSPMARAAAPRLSTVVSAVASIGRIDEHGHSSGAGQHFAQQLQPLCRQLSRLKKLMPVRLPPGRARLATRPSATGSSATAKTIGIVVVAALAANAAARERGDHGDPSANQFGRQLRQPIESASGPAVFDRYVLALDVAGFFEALAKCAQTVRNRVRRSWCREIRSPASPAAAPAPRAATPPPRRRAALMNSRRLMPGMGLPPRCRRR